MTQATSDDAVWRSWLAAINKPGIGAVIALTVVGGVMRLIRLSHPPLLFDEAATYTRVTGSFEELLNILRFDGFAPLHYELYWLMSRFVRLTPTVMRLVPAIAGTLMIPVMYFLARHVVSKRVATLAAALTAFSAWQLVYSRDAKMYMELWLAATLFIAGLLWWLRECSRIAWLTWVAAGVLMNGLHALGLLIVAVAIVMVLTHALLTRRKLLIATLGLMITCAGIAGHYALFNRFQQRLQTQGWRSGGLDWVGLRNRQMSKPFLLWDTAASWMLAYRSPRPPIEPPQRVIVPVVIITSILGAMLIAGVFPWPRRLRDDDPEQAPPGRGVVQMLIWIALPVIAFACVPLITGRDVWNARYLGVIWPPLTVIVALLILRLPNPHVRGGVIALLIGANLVQYALRLTVESGIPVDQIARDVAAANASNGKSATIVAVKDDPANTSLGGNGGIFDFPGRYYLAIENRLHLRPKQLRSEPFRKNFKLVTEVQHIPPTAHRLIIWTDADKLEPRLLASLEPAWQRVSSNEHAVRDFWCWRRMFRCRRSVYERANDS